LLILLPLLVFVLDVLLALLRILLVLLILLILLETGLLVFVRLGLVRLLVRLLGIALPRLGLTIGLAFVSHGISLQRAWMRCFGVADNQKDLPEKQNSKNSEFVFGDIENCLGRSRKTSRRSAQGIRNSSVF
jgi:hypothetical protein